MDTDLEMDRIQKLKDFRTLFADTAVTTTHFLKKCVRVPKVESLTDPAGEELTERTMDRILRQQ